MSFSRRLTSLRLSIVSHRCMPAGSPSQVAPITFKPATIHCSTNVTETVLGVVGWVNHLANVR